MQDGIIIILTQSHENKNVTKKICTYIQGAPILLAPIFLSNVFLA